MLDSTKYLTSFGWQGNGNGLRDGSVSRPLSIPQKRTLAGLGKDRDEAFPFWDHLFAAAAKSIKIKVSEDVDNISDNDAMVLSEPSLHRTSTGILSNRRPVSGTPATSGTVTPSGMDPQCSKPGLSLIATAKRDSARKRLYAAFFRGPTLGPEIAQGQVRTTTQALVSDAVQKPRPVTPTKPKPKFKDKKRKHDDQRSENEREEVMQRKTERHKTCSDVGRKEPTQPKRRNETVEQKLQRKAERQRRKEGRHKLKEERKLTGNACGTRE